MDKASRAAASARLLLDAGDVDGARNRAYYLYSLYSTLAISPSPPTLCRQGEGDELVDLTMVVM